VNDGHPVMVDTSAWFAAASVGDHNNGRAKQLLRENPRRITTDHVLVETWRLIAHRIGWRQAETWLRTVRGGVAKVEIVDDIDIERAVAIGEAFADQRLSIVDRTTFAVMERLRYDRAVSFDDDFLVYRYGPGRSKAFQVLR